MMTGTALCLLFLQVQDVEEARRRFPPEVTRALLLGLATAPPGFDEAIAGSIGRDRLNRLRKGEGTVEGRENDLAALCLLRLKVDPKTIDVRRVRSGEEAIAVKRTGSRYKVAKRTTSGFFRTGQDADLLLSGIGFNDAGGPLLFNHPIGIATDGTRLYLADTYNNRVLVWNRLPDGNVPPDLVLGQKNFRTNDSGAGRGEMNFPVSVSAAGGKLAVSDAENHRILIWTHIPEKNAVPADVVLQGERGRGLDVSRTNFHWPWGVWTDGTKFAVSSTRGGGVLLWDRFPTRDNAPADRVLRGEGALGTPRHITSNGRCLIVGDHNPRVAKHRSGTFVWKSWPTQSDQPYDYFLPDPASHHGPWFRGTFTSDGKLIGVGSTLFVWKALPENAEDRPDLAIRGYNFRPGDHTGVAVAGGRVYVNSGNLNMILVYRSMPTRTAQRPDFAIGSPDIETDTLETNFIISNPVPASNGKSLFVTSDFDRKLYVWKEIPDESGAHPDLVYSIPDGGWDIALWKETLALVGRRTVYLWKKRPIDGALPDVVFRDRIGSVRFNELRGIAVDGRYFYLSDHRANRVYVWKGIPGPRDEPLFRLRVRGPGRLSTDGKYLAVAPFTAHVIRLYPVDRLASDARPYKVGRQGQFNLAGCAEVRAGHLFVSTGPWGQVHAWRRVEDAIAGKEADVLLGAREFSERRPEIGRDKLSYPGGLSFDGTYLWVGETKFSERLLRFRPSNR